MANCVYARVFWRGKKESRSSYKYGRYPGLAQHFSDHHRYIRSFELYSHQIRSHLFVFAKMADRQGQNYQYQQQYQNSAKDQTAIDNRANQLNKNNCLHQPNQDNIDNRAEQLNSNNYKYQGQRY
ncbi:hypothetical protein TKK_0013430 [Trichogramma kaykai]|uniref:Uncharacterized protein n=1 Tax=Trichogramma kaykai TaxID=54128 RepID=A0ABD2WIM5_9HYME